MTRAFAMIMAGGSSESLSVLTEVRAEPAVPFGGKSPLRPKSRACAAAFPENQQSAHQPRSKQFHSDACQIN